MRMVKRLIILFLILVIALVVAVVIYIRPDKELDMSYQEVDMKTKVWNMVKNRTPEIELTGEEINNLVKKNMVEYFEANGEVVNMTGADFNIQGQEVEAKVNATWGVIPFGVTLNFHIESSGSNLTLEHKSTRIKRIDLSSSWVSLPPITVSLKEHLPDLIEIDHIDFNTDRISLMFKIDWSAISPLLLELKKHTNNIEPQIAK